MQGSEKQFRVNLPGAITWKWEGPIARYHHQIIPHGRYIPRFLKDGSKRFMVTCELTLNPCFADVSEENLSLQIQRKLLEQFSECPVNDRLPNAHREEVTADLVLFALRELGFNNILVERERSTPILAL